MATPDKYLTVLADTTRVDSANSADFSSGGSKGIILYLDIDGVTGASPTVDVKLQGKSPNGDYVDVPGAAFAQKNSTFTGSLTVYPGIAETANVSVSDVVPKVWRVSTDMGTVNVTNEVQTVNTEAAGAGDTFDFTYASVESTVSVSFDSIDEATVLASLESIPALDGNVDVTETTPGDVYTVEFINALAGTNVTLLSITSAVGFTPKGDEGYTLGVIETTAGVATDSWNGSVTAHLI